MHVISKSMLTRLISILLLCSLSGCTNFIAGRMPEGGVSMRQAYQHAMEEKNTFAANPSLEHARKQVQDLSETSKKIKFPSFQRLPNPNVVMYVYPHTVGQGANQVPIPGYLTVFPLYLKPHYTVSR